MRHKTFSCPTIPKNEIRTYNGGDKRYKHLFTGKGGELWQTRCAKEIDPPSPLLQADPKGSARAAPPLSGWTAAEGRTPPENLSPITDRSKWIPRAPPELPRSCRGGRPRREGCREEFKNDLWNASRFAGGARLFETWLFQRARLGIHMRGAFANYRIQMPPWDLD